MYKQMMVLLAILMAVACHSGVAYEQDKSPINDNVAVDSVGMPIATANNSLSKQLMLVRTAHVNAEVTSVKIYQQWLNQQLNTVGAYVASEAQSSNADNAASVTLTVKVPVQQFDVLLSLIEAKATRLVDKQVTSGDVTTDYHDAKNKAQTQLHLKARYQELQRQATKMSDIIALQKEIDAIDDAYDVAKGTSKYLAAQSTYSTIHLKIYEPIVVADTEPSYTRALQQALGDGLAVVEGVTLLLVRLWPILLIVGILLFVWKKNKQGHAKK
jgi:hypothetical protein